jgi:hypothetical protein
MQIYTTNKNFSIPILLILFLNFMFIYYSFTSETYETLYDTDTKKFYVIINLIYSYLQIVTVIYALYIFKKYILHLIKNNAVNRAIFIVLLVVFIVYIISVVHFTHILTNFDQYKYTNIHYLSHYFTLIKIINILLGFSYIYALLQRK